MLEIRYFIAADGLSPFAQWLAELDVRTRAKIARSIYRLEQGNLSNVKGVGEGVLELEINVGPGFRVYFGRDGDTVVIILTGGTKKRQQRDIERALAFWREYKHDMKKGRSTGDV